MPRTLVARKTIAYARVSTEDQAKEGVSLDAQRARIEAFALATGRSVNEVIVDAGESAKSLARPGMRRVLAAVRSGEVAALIVLKLDRLTRSVRNLLDLIDLFEESRTDLISVSESLDTASASGRMVVQILGVMAEFERAQLSERTASALAHLRHARRPYGHAPFGWRREHNDLVEVSREQWALSVVRRKHEGGDSLSQIGRWLASEGFEPHQGGRAWRKQTVAQILNSRMALETSVPVAKS